MPAIRLLVADDHEMVRAGLVQFLGASPGIEVVCEASSGDDVLKKLRANTIDLLLLDMSMPGRSGIELIKQVLSEKPRLRVLILSMHEERQYAVRAIRAGAAGYLTKESASAQLVSVIRKVAAGGAFISTEVAEQLALAAMPQTEGLPHTALSDREYQVFQALAAGRTVSEIATQLNLSVKTVSTHKARLMQKMSLPNQAELVRYALVHKLVDA